MMNERLELTETTERLIRNVTAHVQDGSCLLNWHWPDGVPFVGLHKSRPDEPFDQTTLEQAPLKLYTREEYKANGGYREPVESIGMFVYRIFPCVVEAGQRKLLIPAGEDHLVRVHAGTAKIYYRIKSSKNLFSRFQKVQIQIFTEIPVEKDVLCYVKKEGSYPVHKDDGIQYPFIRDFAPGRTILPEIEIRKHDYLRIFLTDGKKYGQLFELLPE